MHVLAVIVLVVCLLKERIETENGQLLKDCFSEQTDVHDWASFFRHYDVFAIYEKRKEWNNKVIRNMIGTVWRK